MDSIKNFKDAAVALQNDPCYIDLINARNLNDSDEELQNQIAEFNLTKMEMNAAVSADDQDNDQIANLNEKINRLYDDIMTNESMLAYNEAKMAMDEKLQYINAIIMAAVNGEDPMTVEQPVMGGGCSSGGCSSCSGCH